MFRLCNANRVLFASLGIVLWIGFAHNTSADIVISEVDLANNKIELVNTGGSSVDMSTWWLCNRVNGSPFYSLLSSYTIDAGLSTAGSLNVSAGEILVLNLTNGLLPDANGEMGLYNTNSFGSASAIEDYVLWGANGIRDLVAQNAGIWTDNDSIDVSGAGVGDTFQLGLGLPGNQASDYFVGAGSLGVAQSVVPEPTCLAIIGIAMLGMSQRRRRPS